MIRRYVGGYEWTRLEVNYWTTKSGAKLTKVIGGWYLQRSGAVAVLGKIGLRDAMVRAAVDHPEIMGPRA